MESGGLARTVGRQGWTLVLPAILWTVVFFVAPLIVMMVYSLWQRVGAELVYQFSLANYEQIFSKSYLYNAALNSIEVAAITTLTSIVLGYPFAYILAYRIPVRWQRMALLLAILPFWTSYVVRSYSLLLLLSNDGVLNKVLMFLGLIDAPLALAHNRTAVIVGFTHFFTMMLTLTIYSNLVQIPPNYRRAAADLGASRFQSFLQITLPLSIPGVAIGAFLTFVLAIGDYATPQILGGNRELLLPQVILIEAQRRGDFPLAAAISMVLMLLVVVAYVASARQMRMGRV